MYVIEVYTEKYEYLKVNFHFKNKNRIIMPRSHLHVSSLLNVREMHGNYFVSLYGGYVGMTFKLCCVSWCVSVKLRLRGSTGAGRMPCKSRNSHVDPVIAMAITAFWLSDLRGYYNECCCCCLMSGEYQWSDDYGNLRALTGMMSRTSRNNHVDPVFTA